MLLINLKVKRLLQKTILFAFNLFALLVLTHTVCAQKEESAKRGLQTGAAYSISDIESINNTNGNVMYNIPLASLPAGRGGSGYGVALTYNSKMWDTLTEPVFITPPNSTARATILTKSDNAGWRYGYGYKFEQKQRPGIPVQPGNPTAACHGQNNPNYSYVDLYKFVMTFPDGSSHEFEPSQFYVSGITTVAQDNYHAVDVNGTYRRYLDVVSNADNTWIGCEIQLLPYTGGMSFHSTDGSNLRLFVAHDGDNIPTNNFWTLKMPDGSRVTQNEPIGGGLIAGQRIYDRNDNFTEITETAPNAYTRVIQATDQLGRSLTISQDSQTLLDTITSAGFNNAQLVWTVKWKALGVSRRYKLDTDEQYNEFNPATVSGVFKVVDEITLPAQIGGQKYQFQYNGNANGDLSAYSNGFGEVEQAILPSGATVDYQYDLDGTQTTVSSWQSVMHNPVEVKTLTYQTVYDGLPETIVENWSYNIGRSSSTITGPDGSVSGAGYSDVYDGGDGTVRTTSTNNSSTTIIPYTLPNYSGPFDTGKFYKRLAKLEFTTIKDASGNPSLTAIKEYAHDLNGNLLRIKEYDWVPFSSITYNQLGEFVIPSSAVLKRVTVNEYYNPVSELTSGQPYTNNEFHKVGSPKILNAVKNTETRNATNNAVSRIEFVYDGNLNAPIKGNVTETRVWDSTKAATLPNPDANGFKLSTNNSISSSATYDQYGNPTLMTDAKDYQTQITYGAVGSYTDLYPTQTKTAYTTAIQRTSTAQYDFSTGLVTSATDVDNNVTSGTDYDALGRPIKVKAAMGTPLEVWTQTEYDDVLRRVITKSDLFTKGDGKKIAVQHYDQLGRVRLTRQIENVATEDPTNEQHGIKVQTRYLTSGSYTYQLASNPYRAATSAAASGEPSMGWTQSKTINTGKFSETETFSGAALPAAFGGNNTNSSGVVRTDADAERTLVTDQAGKRRISRTNALGQLTDVWEVKEAEAGQTEAITFGALSLNGLKTSYQYNTLNNLTKVIQGAQSNRNFAYSSLSRLLSAQNPESGTIAYQYDANGNLTKKTDARLAETNYVYDALNRVTSRSYTNEPTGQPATPTVTYTYDNVTNAKGKLTKVSSSVSETSYTAFDTMGRVLASEQRTPFDTETVAQATPRTMSYVYNLSGALIEETYPSTRVVKNVLDNDGELSIVQSKKNQTAGFWNYAQHFTYTAAGAVSSMRLGNGKWESTEFNSRLQPVQIALGTVQNGTDKLKLNFDYGTTNNNGNVLSQQITVPTVGSTQGFVATQAYTYDSLNRLKSAEETIPNQTGWKQTFLYDRYGNRNFDTANTTTLGGCPAAQCNPTIDQSKNRFTTAQGYTYDLTGNLVTDAEGRSFVFDGENKQKSVTNSSGTLGTYFYDGDGKRVKKIAGNEVTIFIYDASGKLVAEYANQIAALADAKVSYLTSDHLGSPRINTDANGLVTARHDYHPFGEEISRISYGADNVRKQFATYERDVETNLDFAQARMYNKNLGRFSSTDPILISNEHPVNPQRWNLYIYVINNPLTLNDPDGKKPKKTIDIFLGWEKIPKEWKQLRNQALKKGIKLNIYAGKSATTQQFTKSLSTKGRTVVFFGHATTDPDSYGKHVEKGASLKGKGVGLMFNDGNVGGGEFATTPISGVDTKAKAVVAFACDFTKLRDEWKSSTGTKLLYNDNGDDGISGEDAGNEAALKVVNNLVNGNSLQAGKKAAQTVFDNRQNDIDKQTGAAMNVGDRIRIITLPNKEED